MTMLVGNKVTEWHAASKVEPSVLHAGSWVEQGRTISVGRSGPQYHTPTLRTAPAVQQTLLGFHRRRPVIRRKNQREERDRPCLPLRTGKLVTAKRHKTSSTFFAPFVFQTTFLGLAEDSGHKEPPSHCKNTHTEQHRRCFPSP